MVLREIFLDIDGAKITVRLIAERRSSLRLSFKNGIAKVQYPINYTSDELKDGIQRLTYWLSGLKKKKPNLFIPKEKLVLTHGMILNILDQPYRIDIILNHTKNTFKANRSANSIQYEIPKAYELQKEVVYKNFMYFLSKLFLYDVHVRLEQINNRTIQGQLGKVTIRNVESRWGSCSGDNNIMLSSKLLLLPLNILDHVIIHELVHTKIKDHSRRFWSQVALFDPEWRKHHKWLADHGGLVDF